MGLHAASPDMAAQESVSVVMQRFQGVTRVSPVKGKSRSPWFQNG